MQGSFWRCQCGVRYCLPSPPTPPPSPPPHPTQPPVIPSPQCLFGDNSALNRFNQKQVRHIVRPEIILFKQALTIGLLLGRSEVLRSLRHYLRAQTQGHHTTDRLEERGVEGGSPRRSSSKGRERATVIHTNIGIVPKATLGKPLRDGMERIIVGFSERIDTMLN